MAIDLELVEHIPEVLEADKLYVSLAYRTSAPLCGCGCGSKVVLKLGRRHWYLILDGESVSMYPSVGNWQLPCRSHYWIRDGRIVDAGWWSDEKILRERKRRRRQRTRLPLWQLDDGNG